MPPADQSDHPPQATSSHMMKTTKRGRPFLKACSPISSTSFQLTFAILQDTLDLFATLIVSLQLTTHKQYFRTFPNSFSTSVLPCPSADLDLPTMQGRGGGKFGFAQVLAVEPRAGSQRQNTNRDDNHYDHFFHDSRYGKGHVPALYGRTSH